MCPHPNSSYPPQLKSRCKCLLLAKVCDKHFTKDNTAIESNLYRNPGFICLYYFLHSLA